MHRIHREQVVPASLENVWDFIKDPNNLNAITPDDLNFKIVSNIPPQMVFEKMKWRCLMKTCSLNHFLEAVKPWIDSEYIRNAHLDADGNFELNFVDGGKNVYRIDDCSREQLKAVLADLKEKGIPVKA